MRGDQEKIWFIYLSDHHEGPFSVDEILSKLTKGIITEEQYLWKEGMENWEPFHSLPAFKPKEVIPDPPKETPKPQEEPKRISPVESITILSELPTSEIVPLEQESPLMLAEEKTDDIEIPLDEPPPPKTKKRMILALGFVLLFISLGATYSTWKPMIDSYTIGFSTYLMDIGEAIPVLKNYIKIPLIPQDITKEHQIEFKRIYGLDLDTHGVKADIAFSTIDPLTPKVYLGSNLPDGTKVKLILNGEPATLLNQLQYTKTYEERIFQGVVSFPMFKQASGHPIPQGKYKLTIYETDEQPAEVSQILTQIPEPKPLADFPKGKRLMLEKQVFLAGKDDDTYRTRLRAYHLKVKENSNKELIELKEYLLTLNSQLLESVNTFKSLKGKKNPKNITSWNKFSKNWSLFQDQMKKTIAMWNPETLKKTTFHTDLYLQVRELFSQVQKTHDLHQQFFNQKVDLSSFDIQLAQSQTQAALSLQTVKSLIEKNITESNQFLLPRRLASP